MSCPTAESPPRRVPLWKTSSFLTLKQTRVTFTRSPPTEIDLVLQALICGTRDYVCKSGFRAVVVGLSGGIDSSVVAAIAVAALGRENVLGVSMPGPYSSEGSRADARQLAENLGIEFLTIPITDVFQSYRTALADAFRGRPEDVTEENLQARVRGNLLDGAVEQIRLHGSQHRK